MSVANPLRLSGLLRQHPWRLLLTVVLQLLEVVILALVPLAFGTAIDALLATVALQALQPPALLLGALLIISVARRAWDTRVFGTLRVAASTALIDRGAGKTVSTRAAQVEMARELVDFLEEQWPLLLASGVQLGVALVVLFGFGVPFGVGGVLSVAVVLGLYALFQPRFYRLTRALNGLSESQVSVLQAARRGTISRFFRQRRAREVALSDLDSALYGAIYAVMFAFVLGNLWLASLPTGPSPAATELVTAGSIFVVVSYSWALVESAAQLPATAQHWTRLTEIQERLSKS